MRLLDLRWILTLFMMFYGEEGCSEGIAKGKITLDYRQL